MRRELVVGVLALAGGVAVAFGAQYVQDRFDLGSSTATPTSAPSPAEPTAAPSATAEPPPPTAPGVPAPPADAQPMLVRWVYDGDTVQLQAEAPGEFVTITGKIDVRLIGVDTPELRPAPECYAEAATTFLRGLLPQDTRVLVAPDRQSWDDYKRRLFYLWRADDQRFVNYEIVAAGNGEAIRIWPNVAHIELLRATQQAAQSAGQGLWGAC